MVTLEGRAGHEGVAVAVGAVVDAEIGIRGVSPVLLQEGIRAVMRPLPVEDCPEAIIACDDLAVGASLRIPGVVTVGIAAESGDTAGLTVEVPCVVGVPDLLKSISEGDLLVVDGNKGIVCVDPDP